MGIEVKRLPIIVEHGQTIRAERPSAGVALARLATARSARAATRFEAAQSFARLGVVRGVESFLRGITPTRIFHVWMDVDPERVAWARAFLSKHDPELLHRLDAEVRNDEYQRMRLKVIVYMFGDCSPDVQNEKVRIFFDSVRDAAGNLPTWLHEVEV